MYKPATCFLESISLQITGSVLVVADGFAAGSCTKCRHNFDIGSLLEKLGRTIGHQALGTTRVAAAHVVLKRRALIDRKGLIKYIESIDPLAIRIDRIFGDQNRLAGTVANHGQAHTLVCQHRALGRIIRRSDPLAIHPAVITTPPALNQRSLPRTAGALIYRQNCTCRSAVGRAIKGLKQVGRVVEIFLVKLGQNVQ